MKNYCFMFFLILSSFISFAQIITSSNGNVGVGTSAPLQKFTIKSPGTLTGSSSTDYDFGITDGGIYQVQLLGLVNSEGNYGLLQVIKGGIGAGNLILQHQGGNVGVGVPNPFEKFEVAGRIKAGDRIYANSTDVNALSLVQAYNSAGGPSVLRSYSGTSFWDFAASQTSGGNSLFIGQGMDISVNNAAIAIVSNNNVGIGTNDPKGYKLAVNGNIRAKEVKVETVNWPDYVFARSYRLPTMQETEKHIKEKGHLPGVPSAAEVKANGIDLGEMNAKLLQKIEELTLHLIEQNKTNQIQKYELKSQREILIKIQTELDLLRNTKKKN
jgi:hypothetical protein